MYLNINGGNYIHYLPVTRITKKRDNALKLTKYCVRGVHCNLILCSVSDQPLAISESNIAGCGPISLVVGNDLNFTMLENTYAGVCCPQINTNCRSLRHDFCAKRESQKYAHQNRPVGAATVTQIPWRTTHRVSC